MARARLTKTGHAYSTQSHLKREILDVFYQNVEYAALDAIADPVEVKMTFHMPVPQSTSKRALKTIDGAPHHVRCDLDNLIKFISDVFNGILWVDDSLIWKIDARKVYTIAEPRTEIEIL